MPLTAGSTDLVLICELATKHIFYLVQLTLFFTEREQYLLDEGNSALIYILAQAPHCTANKHLHTQP